MSGPVAASAHRCVDCNREVSGSRSPRCGACRDANERARMRASYVRRYADPAYRARRCAYMRRYYAEAAADPAWREARRARRRELYRRRKEVRA